MKKSIKIVEFFLVSMLYAAQGDACVINMEELYNPDLNQTVILIGDMHATLPEVDEPQYNALLSEAKKYRAHVIIEGDVDFLFVNDPRVMLRFANACSAEHIPLSNIEFRKHSRCLMRLESYAYDCKKLDEIQYFFERYVTKPDVFDAFAQIGIESVQVKKEIVEFIAALKKLPKKNSFEKDLLFFIEAILRRNDRVFEEIKSSVQYTRTYSLADKEEAVDAMINDFFFEREGRVYAYADSAYGKAFKLQSIFLDIRVMKQIYAHRKERVLFVYTGQAHTERISCVLRAIGFELKFQNSNDTEISRLLKGMYSDKELDEVFKSDAVMPCYLNIDEFFSACSTLPEYPQPSYVSRIIRSLIGVGMLGAAIYMIRAWFFRKDGTGMELSVTPPS